MIRIVVFVLINAVVFSCVKEFKFKIDELPKKVVVNSLFCPDSLFKINVSITSAVGQLPVRVNNAFVVVYMNNETIDAFNSIGNGWYQSAHYPEVGASYKVVIKVDGYDSVWAESYVPEYPEIIDQPISKIFGVMVRNGEEILARDTYLTFDDIDVFENFYEVFFEWGFQSLVHIERITDESLLTESDLDVQQQGIPNALFFSNNLFRGQEKLLVIPGLFSVPSGFPVSLDYFDLHFSSVSREYFLYRKSLFRHLFNLNDSQHINDPITLLFIGNPIELYSNVEGGTGVFAGYNMRKILVEVEN